ncbi:MAG: type II methionyl aminopeptidase [Desulfurococcaceae archaeon]
MLEEHEVKKLIMAGDVVKRALRLAEGLVRPGASVLRIAEEIEGYMRELGAEPAFPANIGVNEVAAHYTPLPGDRSTIPDGSVVKVDVGAHVDGYIADAAITVSLNPALEGLVEATREALSRALEAVRPGARAYEVGARVEEVAKSMGFRPVRNLSGHSIGRYSIHGGRSIPNYKDVLARWKFEEGVYAVEPFLTSGEGVVVEAPLITIHALTGEPRSEDFLISLWRERRTLPFAVRWYASRGLENVAASLERARRSRKLVDYPVLVERGRGPVAQFEHTVVLVGREVIVTTA